MAATAPKMANKMEKMRSPLVLDTKICSRVRISPAGFEGSISATARRTAGISALGSPLVRRTKVIVAR
jgi:hypothetical protein